MKVSKSIIFLVKSFLGNFYRHLGIFSGHTALNVDGERSRESSGCVAQLARAVASDTKDPWFRIQSPANLIIGVQM